MATAKRPLERPKCSTCTGRETSEWCALGEGDIARLEQSKVCKAVRPGEVLFSEGDDPQGIHCIHSATVGVRKIDGDGNSVLLRLAGPGETLGYRAFLADRAHLTTAEVLSAGTVCFIRRVTVRSMLDRTPTLGLAFLDHAARDLQDAEEKFLRSSTLSVRARLIHTLLVLRDRHARSGNQDDTVFLHLPISRQDLAAMIGARPETLSRTIRQLEGDGVARFAGRAVHVPHMDMLLDEIAPLGLG